MKDDTIRRILILASGFNATNSPRSRHDRAAKVSAWKLALEHAGLTDTDLEAMETAVIDYYTENTDTLMPAHIISRINTNPRPTISGILTQPWPCTTCGLGPTNSTHTNGHHNYISAEPGTPTRQLPPTPTHMWQIP